MLSVSGLRRFKLRCSCNESQGIEINCVHQCVTRRLWHTIAAAGAKSHCSNCCFGMARCVTNPGPKNIRAMQHLLWTASMP